MSETETTTDKSKTTNLDQKIDELLASLGGASGGSEGSNNVEEKLPEGFMDF